MKKINNLHTFSGSTPMSSQNFSMPSGPTTSSQPGLDKWAASAQFLELWMHSSDGRMNGWRQLNQTHVEATCLHTHRTTPNIFYWKTSPPPGSAMSRVFWKCCSWGDSQRNHTHTVQHVNVMVWFKISFIRSLLVKLWKWPWLCPFPPYQKNQILSNTTFQIL